MRLFEEISYTSKLRSEVRIPNLIDQISLLFPQIFSSNSYRLFPCPNTIYLTLTNYKQKKTAY